MYSVETRLLKLPTVDATDRLGSNPTHPCRCAEECPCRYRTFEDIAEAPSIIIIRKAVTIMSSLHSGLPPIFIRISQAWFQVMLSKNSLGILLRRCNCRDTKDFLLCSLEEAVSNIEQVLTEGAAEFRGERGDLFKLLLSPWLAR